MYTAFEMALKYVRYQLHASNGKGHGIHSPFVFEFVTRVLNDKTAYPDYTRIEALRKKMLADHMPIPLKDYGAGSFTAAGRLGSGTVASFAASAAKPARYAQLLFRIVRYYRPHYMLELGTSLGISTAYLAAAGEQATVITGEGNPALAEKAENNFRELGLANIRVVTGNFDHTLPQLVSAVPHIDLAFIDGNHREQPTIDYFRRLSEHVSPSSVLIFDDIHWSRGMESAWNHISAHPSVMLSIDLFSIGIVFFREDFKVKQHFSIRY